MDGNLPRHGKALAGAAFSSVNVVPEYPHVLCKLKLCFKASRRETGMLTRGCGGQQATLHLPTYIHIGRYVGKIPTYLSRERGEDNTRPGEITDRHGHSFHHAHVTFSRVSITQPIVPPMTTPSPSSLVLPLGNALEVFTLTTRRNQSINHLARLARTCFFPIGRHEQGPLKFAGPPSRRSST
ncbi:hypothetical protein LY76DRAFT_154627 [Colletotrichum caudatum]|nr:hypothetical protein LY76DRAFT_154627 [Colletotrichum caudatum]